MADNLTTTTTVSTIPSGTVIATDDSGTGHVQLVKLALSADGSRTHLSADADGLLVNLGANNDVTVAGVATAANQSTANTALAAIQTAVELIDNTVSGTELQVDVVAALPAGTNAIGKLAANSGVDIGDVDVTSLPTTVHSADFDTGAGTDTTLAFGIAVPASGGAAVVPGDATAGLKVDLGADNDVTVTGTVTANLAAGTNNIGDVDVLSIAAGDNNIGNVDIVTMPNVTLAAGTNTNEVVGDAAHDAAIAGNPVRVGARALSADYTAVATGDTADVIASLLGKLVCLRDALPGQTWSYAAASGGITNTTGVTAKAAAGAGSRNYITAVQVINGHATVSTDVQIRDGAAGTVLWRGFAAAAGGGCAIQFAQPLRGSDNTLVEIACGTTGTATYFNLQGFTAAE